MKAVIQPASFLADVRNSGMSDDEHEAIIASIADDPAQGVLIVGSGGAHKDVLLDEAKASPAATGWCSIRLLTMSRC